MTMNTPPTRDLWKSEFLTRISHEMRTPLTTIIGYSEVMLSDPKLPQEAKQEYMEIIRNAGRRLSQFLDAYLESEVVERNKQLVDKHREDLSLLAQHATERVSAQADAMEVSVGVRCEPAIYIDSAEPEHMIQILENLLINAIDLAPSGGHIEVTAVQRSSVIEIEVFNRDRGSSNFSVSAASKKFRWIQSPGIEIHHDGLGLAFAKHVVELEGGLLKILCFDQGLTFTLQFPRNCNN
jgi:cell cycle sensor histidine kinase DivJ